MPTAIRHFESAEHIVVQSARGPQTALQAPSTSVSFRSLGRQFDLDLEPSNLFARTHRTVWTGGGREDDDVPVDFLYRGSVQSEPGSWARIRIRHGELDGMIWTPNEIYFVEPESRLSNDPTKHRTVVYRMSDIDHEVLRGACGLAHPATPSAEKALASPLSSDGGTPFRPLQAVAPASTGPVAALEQATLGIVADYDYFSVHGADSAADMQSIINQVAGIFQAQVGVDLVVTQTLVYTTSPDPFDRTTDPVTLLNEFSTYKTDTSSPVHGTDLAHLFTGRTLDGGVLGIAWIGTLCDPTYSTGLSGDSTTDDTLLVLLAAHEIGHIFGAYHDNEAGSACASVPFGYIMNPYISSGLSLQFSGCSLSLMDPGVARASCLSSVVMPTPTATPSATQTPTWAPQPTQTRTPSPTHPAMTPMPTRTRTRTPTPTSFWRWIPVPAPTPVWRWTPVPTPTPAWRSVPVATPTPAWRIPVATPTPWWLLFGGH